MKILVVGVGPWNDIQYGNNIMSNWFYGFNAEFANIYVHIGMPCNKLCRKYFQVTDEMMLHSWKKRAGISFSLEYEQQYKMQKEAWLYADKSKIALKANFLPNSISNLIKDFISLVSKENF